MRKEAQHDAAGLEEPQSLVGAGTEQEGKSAEDQRRRQAVEHAAVFGERLEQFRQAEADQEMIVAPTITIISWFSPQP